LAQGQSRAGVWLGGAVANEQVNHRSVEIRSEKVDCPADICKGIRISECLADGGSLGSGGHSGEDAVIEVLGHPSCHLSLEEGQRGSYKTGPKVLLSERKACEGWSGREVIGRLDDGGASVSVNEPQTVDRELGNKEVVSRWVVLEGRMPREECGLGLCFLIRTSDDL